ncbi:hypothetical protein CDL15_Pgr009253 [Punica granatum]|uniref:Late embryogenesis abundant protein LEA-2 subgroup domain-containing protein n=1 Tax=Punica granatum TaxID=22663 RepID=A0A218WW30_PUNGR|nr:hypothetical protein CDL15_Pgr009253 [Punica granatum]
MSERIYPASRPAANGTASVAAATKPPFPATKAQLYGTTRPTYRPQPQSHRRRGCCCTLCIWLTLTVIALLFLAAIATAVLYLMYHPHRPSFSVTALKISALNLTSSSLTSKFDVSVTARNPNKHVTYSYDPVSISIYTNKIDIGDGSIPAFVHGKENITSLRTSVISNKQQLDSNSAGTLRSQLKSKNLDMEIKIDTKVRAKMGGMKTPRVGIRVTCRGIKASVPTGKSSSRASTANAKCKVDMRIKIWKWVF